jgi:hypothetical protein
MALRLGRWLRLFKPIDRGGDAPGNRLACFRFNDDGGPDHRPKVAGKLSVEPTERDVRRNAQ